MIDTRKQYTGREVEFHPFDDGNALSGFAPN